MKKTTTISHEDICSLVRSAADLDIKEQGYTSIIGISRGGFVPAVMLSHVLGIEPVYGVTNYKRTHIKNELDMLRAYHPNHMINPLIVDEIIDTGKAHKEFIGSWKTKEIMAMPDEVLPVAEPDFLALFDKQGLARYDLAWHADKNLDNDMVFKTDAWEYGLEAVLNTWIVFPWEREALLNG